MSEYDLFAGLSDLEEKWILQPRKLESAVLFYCGQRECPGPRYHAHRRYSGLYSIVWHFICRCVLADKPPQKPQIAD